MVEAGEKRRKTVCGFCMVALNFSQKFCHFRGSKVRYSGCAIEVKVRRREERAAGGKA
jgi:hypothetical protein